MLEDLAREGPVDSLLVTLNVLSRVEREEVDLRLSRRETFDEEVKERRDEEASSNSDRFSRLGGSGNAEIRGERSAEWV